MYIFYNVLCELPLYCSGLQVTNESKSPVTALDGSLFPKLSTDNGTIQKDEWHQCSVLVPGIVAKHFQSLIQSVTMCLYPKCSHGIEHRNGNNLFLTEVLFYFIIVANFVLKNVKLHVHQ